jgi:mycoketide-CoA synthase
MVSVRLPAGEVRPMLQRWRGRLDIAAVNGPSSIVVSGEPRAAKEFIAACETEGIQARALAVDYASHGQQVEAIRDRFLDRLGPVSSRPPRIAFFSTVTGEPVTDGDLDAAYWYRNLRQTVQFERVASTLLSRGHGTFIEVSPHPVLAAPIQEIIDEADVDARFVGTLHRDDGGWRRMLISVAQAHAARSRVDWRALLPSGGRRVSLPTYAFQHKRYWLASPEPTGNVARLGQIPLGHPMLAAAIWRADDGGVLITGRLSAADHPWIDDHVAAGMVLLPATAFADLARCVADHCGCGDIAELIMETPLPLPERANVQLQVTVSSPDDSGQRQMAIYSCHADGDPWTQHVRGLLGAEDSSQGGAAGDDMARAWPPEGAVREDISQLYSELAEAGYQYGPAFSGLRAMWRLDSDIYAEACLPEMPDTPESGFGIHPALLDAVLHAALSRALADGEHSPGDIRLPFSFSGVRLRAAHGSVLRARISPVSEDTVEVVATDTSGSVVARINRLTLRPVTTTRITAAGSPASRELLRLDWVPVPSGLAAGTGPWVVAGPDPLGVASLLGADSSPDLAKVSDGTPVPAVVVVTAVVPDGAAAPVPAGSQQGNGDVPAMVRELCAAILSVLQQWLSAGPAAESRLVVLTRGAVPAVPGDAVAAGAAGLAGAAVWGLVRSAQAEEQGRFVLVDVDGMTESLAALPAAVGSGEPQVAVRGGQILSPRLGRAAARRALSPSAGSDGWRLTMTGQGTLDGLALVEDQPSCGPLRPGQVRMKVRAAGVNFRDVVVALGMLDPEDGAGIGIEGAGVVLETAGPVNGLAPGDRVMGLLHGGIGPVSVTDHRVLVKIPEGWPIEQAAGVPVVFLTAYEGLVELAGLQAGESVLVHAGTGGVGMAAIQLARHLGAEIFATASPAKWEALRSLGLDDTHIASSRSVEFEARFRAATGGRGVDLVLNSLAGELTDASLRLLAPGGRFIEMGKTDIRDPGQVAAAYPGVTYQAFDLMRVKPDGIARMLSRLMGLFEAGALRPLPVTAWDIREAGDAFRYISQARHTGKVVLTLPQVLDADGPDTGGPVLVTGGTGTLGGLVARHLAARHGARELVLTSRRGPGAPGAGRLAADLAGMGARVRVTACDAASRDEVAGLLTWAGRGRPLAGVVHCAGLLRDATVTALSQADLDQVLAAKADAAWHLHELTSEMDLRMFVTFSSVAGVLGTPGQGNYAAANAFLDALASWRRGRGQAGASLAWGLWEQASGMTGHLAQQDLARLRRTGLVPLSSARGLELFDAGIAGPDPAVVAARLDTGMLAGQARSGMLPAVLRGLIRNPATAAVATDISGLADQLAGLDADGQRRVALEMIQAQAAVVLGHDSPGTVETDRAFRDMGFDSLTAVELRNRLAAVTGLRLPATVAFDYPTPVALTGYLLGRLRPAAPASSVDAELDRLEALFAEMDANDVGRRKTIARMQHMIARLSSVDRNESSSDDRDVLAAKVGSATAQEVFDLIDREFRDD